MNLYFAIQAHIIQTRIMLATKMGEDRGYRVKLATDSPSISLEPPCVTEEEAQDDEKIQVTWRSRS